MIKMKKFLKRAAAGALALAMCAGLAGCYSEDKAWAAKMGNDTMPIGGYIYYLSSAYSQASALVEDGQEVLKNTVENQSAKDWIEEKAMGYLRSFYFVEQKFNELGLSLDAEDKETISNASNSMWSYYKTAFETMGVAQDSFTKAYAEYNVKLQKVMLAMYGAGGERALSEDEMHDFYTGNYIYYNYFYVPLTTTDEEGNSQAMDDEQKEEALEKLREHAMKISSGDETLDLASANYANATGTEPSLGTPIAIRSDSMNEQFADALNGIKNGEAALVDMSTGVYVLQKIDIEEDFQALMEDESRRTGLITELKGEEFSNYVEEQSANVNMELNSKAVSSVNLSLVAETLGKNGTSTAPSSEAETSSSESSAEGSSEESGS